MRLRQSSLKKLQVLRPIKKESGYVGTTVQYQPDRSIRANVQPAECKRTIALYGDRVKRMYTLLLCPPDRLAPDERVIIGGRLYEVVAAPEYSGHVAVTVEVAQDGTD